MGQDNISSTGIFGWRRPKRRRYLLLRCMWLGGGILSLSLDIPKLEADINPARTLVDLFQSWQAHGSCSSIAWSRHASRGASWVHLRIFLAVQHFQLGHVAVLPRVLPGLLLQHQHWTLDLLIGEVRPLWCCQKIKYCFWKNLGVGLSSNLEKNSAHWVVGILYLQKQTVPVGSSRWGYCSSYRRNMHWTAL